MPHNIEYEGNTIQLRDSFNLAKEYLEKENYHIISLEEQANLRLLADEKTENKGEIFWSGNYVSENFIYHPTKGVFITKRPPILDYAQEATESNRNHEEFFINQTQFEISLKDCIKLTSTQLAIPTDRFGDSELTNFLFGNKANDYGLLLKKYGLNYMQILGDSGVKPFARQLYLEGIGENHASSWINGRLKDLSYDYRVVGVKN